MVWRGQRKVAHFRRWLSLPYNLCGFVVFWQRGGSGLVLIGATTSATQDFSAEMLATGLFEGETPERFGRTAASLVSSGDFTGKVGETSLLYRQEGLGAPRLLLVGLGERERFTPERLRRAAATVARRARNLKLREAALYLPALPEGGARAAAKAAAEGARLGLYRFDRHKSDAENHELETFWLVGDEQELGAASEGAEVGQKAAWG